MYIFKWKLYRWITCDIYVSVKNYVNEGIATKKVDRLQSYASKYPMAIQPTKRSHRKGECSIQ